MANLSLNIFKVNQDITYDEVKALIMQKNEDKTGHYETEKEHRSGLNEFKIFAAYAYISKDAELKKWERHLLSLFDELNIASCTKGSNTCYAYVLIDCNGSLYLITFGSANKTLGTYIDYNFGLEMATRMLNRDAITMQASKFYAMAKNKSITEFSNITFSGTVGENIEGLNGELIECSGKHSIELLLEFVEKKATFTSNVVLSMKEEMVDVGNLCSIIYHVNEIRNHYGERIPIPRLVRIREKETELLERLNNKFNEELLSGEIVNQKIIIPFYQIRNADFIFTNDVATYRLSYMKNYLETNTLTIDYILNFMREHDIYDIDKIKVRVISESGQCSDVISCKDLIEYTTCLNDDNNYYALSDGKWSRYNKEYLNVIKDEFEKIKRYVEFDEEYDYNEIETKRFADEYQEELREREGKCKYRELLYNFRLFKIKNAILCDRQTVAQIEVCDLYMNNDELVHVKFGTTSNFSECIQQSRNGILAFKFNKNQVRERLKIYSANVAKLVFITSNQAVLRNEDVSKFKSLSFKIQLIEWVKFVNEHGMKPVIIFGKEVL